MRVRAAALAVAIGVAPATAIAQPVREPTPEEKSIAEALFDEARRLRDEGKYAACSARLEESQRLDPGGGTLLNLATCRRLEGKTATAHALFVEALAVARRDGRSDRVEAAERAIAELEPTLAFVVVVVPEGARVVGLSVELGDARLADVAWGTRIPVDPGTIRVSVSAPGHTTQTTDIAAAPSSVTPFTVTALRVRADDPARPSRSRIAWRPGIAVRADVDGRFRGATAYAGAFIGLGSFFDVGAGALLGPTFGFEIAARALPFDGPVRPFVLVGAPVFVDDGDVFPGIRVAAGLEWFVWDHLSLVASTSVAHFPTHEAGIEATVFVPSLGVSGRL